MRERRTRNNCHLFSVKGNGTHIGGNGEVSFDYKGVNIKVTTVQNYKPSRIKRDVKTKKQKQREWGS